MPMLSGIIWPIEAMPVWLQHISVILPMTLPAQSIRAIMGRGMYHPSPLRPSLILCMKTIWLLVGNCTHVSNFGTVTIIVLCKYIN